MTPNPPLPVSELPHTGDKAPVAESGADHESRLEPDDHTALKLWLRMMTCRDVIGGTLRRRLRTEFNTSSPRFELLAQLARQPEGLKMNELSQRLMVTSGNITALADLMEAEGLISRESVPDDRRAIRLKLTDEGRRRFEAVARVHENWVITMFEGLTRAEQTELYALLGKLKTSVTRSLGAGDSH